MNENAIALLEMTHQLVRASHIMPYSKLILASLLVMIALTP